jgi:hypothetical protein
MTVTFDLNGLTEAEAPPSRRRSEPAYTRGAPAT